MPFDKQGNMSSYQKSPMQKKPMESMRSKVTTGMQMETDNEMLPLSKTKYPQLANAPKGSKIKGMWEGTVGDDDGDMVNIELTSMDIETENSADAEFKRMSKQEGSQEGLSSGKEDDDE